MAWTGSSGGGGEANRDLASQAEAEAGTDNVKGMTPLRSAQAIAALESGGGGGRVTSWKTVGTDGSDDYATISAALDDGEYSLIMTSSVTETVGTTPPNTNINVIVESPTFAWTFASNVGFDGASYTSAFRLFLNGGTIAWASTSSNFSPFNMTNSGGTFEIYGGGKWNNTSTITLNAIAHANLRQGYFGHHVINLPNVTSCGIRSSTRLTADSIELIGGGSACAYAINNGSTDFFAQRIGSLEVTGSWSTSLSPLALSKTTTVTKLVTNLTSTTTPITLGGTITRYLPDASNTNPISISDGADVNARLNAIPDTTVFTFPATLSGVRFLSTRFSIEPDRIVYKKKSTTASTKVELFIDNNALQFDLASNDMVRFDLTVTGFRDNQEFVTFTALGLVIKNDGGTTTLDGAITSGGNDKNDQTGTLALLDVSADDTNDSLKVEITPGNTENWDWATTLSNITLINN